MSDMTIDAPSHAAAASRHFTLADRLAARAGWLLGLLHVVAALAFLLALGFAAGRAHAAETVTCAGKDLLAGLSADTRATMEKDAAAEPNGEGLLWRVSKPGVRDSFLFGTMHMSDPRILALPPAAQSAFDAASTLVIETTDVLDPQKMSRALLTRPDLMMFTDATTLPGLLDAGDRAVVERRFAELGLSLDAVQKMKPWLIAAMVGMPACEKARKEAGAEVLDIWLANKAKAAGKEIAGLESVADQLEAMASLPMDLHMRGLVETARLGGAIDDVTETMVRIYMSGRTGLFWPFFRAALPGSADDAADYAVFQEAMITGRNRTMAERAMPVLDRGNAFVAVGALHLPGRDGLVEKLRVAGFGVEAVR